MNTNIFIPKKINVGFQNRSDTYTQQLAYIIYTDEKGKLRKETSWQSWRNQSIPSQEFDNVPTSGFVMNKKVGDYKSDWNHRQAYVRVYDPRNFEFEITIENLLYILENANSIRGKGLEGDFIYAWEGKNLVLIPTESPDYVDMNKFNTIVHNREQIKAKDLILGATYITKDNNEWIYIGRFDYWDINYDYSQRDKNYKWTTIKTDINKGRYHYFAERSICQWGENKGQEEIDFHHIKALGDKIISVVSTDCVEDYANIFDQLECTKDYSPYDQSKDEYIPYTLEEFMEKCNKADNVFGIDKKEYYVYYSDSKNLYFVRCSDYNHTPFKTLEEIFNILQPMYKNEYLTNNKFYRRQR